jgi:hypothetical protein
VHLTATQSAQVAQAVRAVSSMVVERLGELLVQIGLRELDVLTYHMDSPWLTRLWDVMFGRAGAQPQTDDDAREADMEGAPVTEEEQRRVPSLAEALHGRVYRVQANGVTQESLDYLQAPGLQQGTPGLGRAGRGRRHGRRHRAARHDQQQQGSGCRACHDPADMTLNG